jgi:hypothetical protein
MNFSFLPIFLRCPFSLPPSVRTPRYPFAVSVEAVVLAITIGIAPSASAQSVTSKSFTAAAEAAWTNCPAMPVLTTDCNYTAVYGAQASGVDSFFTITMANVRVFPDGSSYVLTSATGYVQPATVVVDNAGLSNASVSGEAYLYGNCGDPSNISTCSYFGTGTISVAWVANGPMASWKQPSTLKAQGFRYNATNIGASRASAANASATYNGSAWDIGSQISGRIFRSGGTQKLHCPGKCPDGTNAANRQSSLASQNMTQGVSLGAPSRNASGIHSLFDRSSESIPPLRNSGK